MNNNIKLIRARLARNGFKGVSSELIKEVILKYTDGLAEFTEEQKDAVTAELLERLKVTETAIEPTEQSTDEVNQEQVDMIHTFVQPESFTTETVANFQSEPDSQPQSGAITQAQKESLIHQIGSDFLDVELDKEAIVKISSEINFDLGDLRQIRKQIVNAIIAYNSYQIEQEKQAVTNDAEKILTAYKLDVVGYNAHLDSVATQVSKVLEVNRSARKSNADELLAKFAIPETKA